MKYSLFLILLTLILMLCGHLLLSDPGYVRISLQGTSIETSLWVLSLSMLLVCSLSIMTVQIISPIVRSNRSLRDLIKQWQLKQARSKTLSHLLKGLTALHKGQYLTALKLFKEPHKQVEIELIQHLSSAKAAHQLGDTHTRDHHLSQLVDITVKDKQALQHIQLLQAEMQTTADQTQHIAYLEKQHKQHPANSDILYTLAICYEKAQQWSSLKTLLPKLKKQHIFPVKTHENMERTCFHQMLTHTIADLINNSKSQSILMAYKKLPKALLTSPEFHESHFEEMLQKKAYAPLESILNFLLDHDVLVPWLNTLAKLPCALHPNTIKRLQTLSKQHNDNAIQAYAWFAIGKQKVLNKDWLSAEQAFSKSIALLENANTWIALANVYYAKQAYEKSASCFLSGTQHL